MKHAVKFQAAFLSLALLLALSFSACAQKPLATDLQYLSDASLKGRLTGTQENEAAARYLADKLAACGYVPLLGDSMQVPFYGKLPANTQTKVTVDGKALAPGTDYIPPLGGNFSVTGTLKETADGLMAVNEAGEERIFVTQSSYRGALPSAEPTDIAQQIYMTEKGMQTLAAAQGKAVVYECASDTVTKSVPNVLAVLPGTDRKKAVIVGAHFDHVGAIDGTDIVFTGAMDNASGAASALAVADLLKGAETPPVDIVFAFWNAEELGLQGSAVGAQVVGMKYDSYAYLNLDAFGLAEGGDIVISTDNGSTEACDFLAKRLTEEGFAKVRSAPDELMRSDHCSFTDGVSVCFSHTMQDMHSVLHRPDDTLDKLNQKELDSFSAALANVISHDAVPLTDGSLMSSEGLSKQEFYEMDSIEQNRYRQSMADSMPANYYTVMPNGEIVESTKGTYFTSEQELQALYPDISVAQQVGDYTLQSIRFYMNGILDEHPGKKQSGKLYQRTADPQNINVLEALYTNGTQAVRYRIEKFMKPDTEGLEMQYDTVTPVDAHGNTYLCNREEVETKSLICIVNNTVHSVELGETYKAASGEMYLRTVPVENEAILALWDVFYKTEVVHIPG